MGVIRFATSLIKGGHMVTMVTVVTNELEAPKDIAQLQTLCIL